ncbi:MAG: hypothetical protein Q4P34_00765 [Tissierellia bacterium]|nr:hypothetical protein [Tissierellia bacterium]
MGLQLNDLNFYERLIIVEHTSVYYSKGKGLGNKYSIDIPNTKAGIRKIPMTEKV